MYVSRAHHGPHVPHSLVPILLGILAVAGTILAWAAFNARPLSTDSRVAVPAPADASRIRSVAYSVPVGGLDHIYVRASEGDAEPVLIAAFPYAFGLHARGSASPAGDRLAVLSVSSDPSFARLTLVNTADGNSLRAEAEFEYLSGLAWSHDGARIAGMRYSGPDEAGRVSASVIEANTATGQATEVATFGAVLEASPVGYAPGGQKLYVVTIDQSGSTLWVVKDGGRVQKVGVLSAGRTRDWALSPDGARLAFVDILPGGDHTYSGRTMLIATGAVSGPAPTEGDQIGVAWTPGGEVADFGGPGGSIHLTGADGEDAYVIPVQWSPDGTMLAARVATASEGNATPAGETIQLATAHNRVYLSGTPGSWVFGFVINVE